MQERSEITKYFNHLESLVFIFLICLYSLELLWRQLPFFAGKFIILFSGHYFPSLSSCLHSSARDWNIFWQHQHHYQPATSVFWCGRKLRWRLTELREFKVSWYCNTFQQLTSTIQVETSFGNGHLQSKPNHWFRNNHPLLNIMIKI